MENLLRIYLIRFLLSIPVGLLFILFVLSPLVRLLLVYDGPPKSGEFAKYLVKIYSVEDVSENIWLYLFLSLFIGEVICFLGESFLYSIYKHVKGFLELELEEGNHSSICKKHPNYCIGLAEGYYSLSKGMAGFSTSLLLTIFAYYVILLFLKNNVDEETRRIVISLVALTPMLLIILSLILHLNITALKCIISMFTIILVIYYAYEYKYNFVLVLIVVALVLLALFSLHKIRIRSSIENYIKYAILIPFLTYSVFLFILPFLVSIYLFKEHKLAGLILLIASYIMLSSLLAFFIYRKKYEELMRAIYRRANLKGKH